MGMSGAWLAGHFPTSWLLVITENPRQGEQVREVIVQETRGSQQESCPLSLHPCVWTTYLLTGYPWAGPEMQTDNVIVHYLSSLAAVTKYRKLGDLNQPKCMLSHFWRPKIQHQFHWDKLKGAEGPHSLWVPRENLLLASSSFWGHWYLLVYGHITLNSVSMIILPWSLKVKSNRLLLPSYHDACVSFEGQPR